MPINMHGSMLMNVWLRISSEFLDFVMNVIGLFEIEHNLSDPSPLSPRCSGIIENVISVRVVCQ